tara:strand:+ start:10234 stop:11397 length:1164 start_codon:yes stop_codon:yes gene_type:complete
MSFREYEVKNFLYFLAFISLGGTFSFGLEAFPRVFNYLALFLSFFFCFLVFARRFPSKFSFVSFFYVLILGLGFFASISGAGALKLATLFLVLLLSIFVARDHTLKSFSELIYRFGKYPVIAIFIGSFLFDSAFYSQFARGEGLSALYGQKNSLGRILVFFWLTVCFLFILKRDKLFLFVWAVLLSYLIYKTESRSSLIAFILIFYFLFLYIFIGQWQVIISASVFFAAIMIALTIGNIDFGEDSVSISGFSVNSTGRLAIWEYLYDRTKNEALYFGFGLGGIYEYGENLGFFDEVGWALTDAHNGFLDLFVQIGLFGFLALIFLYLYVSIASIRNLYGNDRFFGFSVIFLVFFFNFFSSHFLESLTFLNFILFFVYYSNWFHVKGC